LSEVRDVIPHAILVGAGPTGASLSLLLAKHGIAVTLIEAARDFQRVFRGEALMPSGLDALAQMGLSEILDRVPHRPLAAWEFILDHHQLFRVDEPMGSQQPCTLVSQPPLLEALIAEASQYPNFRLVQGVGVKDLVWQNERVIGATLSDGQSITANLVIGTDGRNSIVRQRADLQLVRQPNEIEVLWFKLAAHPKFIEENIFCTILSGDRGFSVFHGAEAGKLHLAWVRSPNEPADWQQTNWPETFAALSPPWLAEHFRQVADTIESPIRLSVVVGRCPQWYRPGVLLLGDAAHPMSPVRAQGINLALRDVIVAANQLILVLKTRGDESVLDAACAQIQALREPEIMRAQHLQAKEAHQGELLRKNAVIRAMLVRLAPLLRGGLRYRWLRRQNELREGVTKVKLAV